MHELLSNLIAQYHIHDSEEEFFWQETKAAHAHQTSIQSGHDMHKWNYFKKILLYLFSIIRIIAN